jgi:hypothetical protein
MASAAAAPPRRFKPEPVEESVRSSRKSKLSHVENADKNRLPQTSDHAQGPSNEDSAAVDSKARRYAPEPVETTTRSSRRKFAPEPVETSARSSKDKQVADKPVRKFAPEPVETTTRSRKAGKTDQEDTSAQKPRRKFAPEPISTEKISRRRASQPLKDESEHSPEQSVSRGSSESSEGQARRFPPELIETAKGTYRHSVQPSPTKSDKTVRPDDDSEEEQDDVSSLEQSRFSAAALSKRNHEEQRRHSFMVPDLPIIESDSGDDSSAPSLTNSGSSAESVQRQNSRRAAGDSYTAYVLRLAAQHTTDKELQDQAMAAYINEVPHEPVAHYGFDEDEEDNVRVGELKGADGADVRTFRRSSQDDLDWEMREMQRHHAQLEAAKREFKHDTAGHSRFSAAALATRHKLEAEKEGKTKKIKAEETEMSRMRAAASPPMLGDDLVFPQTISPKMTRCETDQHPRPRTDESDDEEEEIGQQQLWNVRVKVEPTATTGLWGGFCNKNDSGPSTPRKTGLQTPAFERDNPFDTTTPGRKTPGSKTPSSKTPGTKTPRRRVYGTSALLPLTPPVESEDFTSSVDKKLLIERQIDDEFPDRVITQIYNYLSLGYPSLAWAFDSELSKISRIPVEELRKDDDYMDAKGYIGAPEGDGTTEEDISKDKGGCRRWEALKLYVREWARQSPSFVEENTSALGLGRGGEGWGGNVGVRKGSWAH